MQSVVSFLIQCHVFLPGRYGSSMKLMSTTLFITDDQMIKVLYLSGAEMRQFQRNYSPREWQKVSTEIYSCWKLKQENYIVDA